MTRNEAIEIGKRLGIDLKVDFHSLGSDSVRKLSEEAKSRRYREPRNANGSRERYFFYHLARSARQEAHWLDKHIEEQAAHYSMSTDNHAKLMSDAAGEQERMETAERRS